MIEIILAVTVIVGLAGLHFGIEARRAARARARFLGVPLCAIADCAEGRLVRLVGTVRAGERLFKAPSDSAPTVFYATEFVSIAYENNAFVERPHAASTAGECTFWIESGAQRARIAPDGAEIITDDVWVQEIETDRLPAGIGRELARATLTATSLKVAASRLRYVERRLLPGAGITVVGRARWTPGPTKTTTMSGYRGGTVTDRVLTIVPPEGDVVRVSTDPAMRV